MAGVWQCPKLSSWKEIAMHEGLQTLTLTTVRRKLQRRKERVLVHGVTTQRCSSDLFMSVIRKDSRRTLEGQSLTEFSVVKPATARLHEGQI